MKHKEQIWLLNFEEKKAPHEYPELGTPAKMLYRSGDPDTSKAAAESVDTTTLEGMVLDAIAKHGKQGAIADQILEEFPSFPYSSITARFSALIRKGFVSDTGERRAGKSGRGQRVMIAL
jgi:hypothetical protein